VPKHQTFTYSTWMPSVIMSRIYLIELLTQTCMNCRTAVKQ